MMRLASAFAIVLGGGVAVAAFWWERVCVRRLLDEHFARRSSGAERTQRGDRFDRIRHALERVRVVAVGVMLVGFLLYLAP